MCRNDERELAPGRRAVGVRAARFLPSSVSVCLPSSTTVPTPVGVRKPPSPAPPQRICSISVPCGTRTTSISPDIMRRPVSGLVPICEAITLRTRPLTMSGPMPVSTNAVSLAINVRSRTPDSSNASTRAGWSANPHKSAHHDGHAVTKEAGGIL